MDGLGNVLVVVSTWRGDRPRLMSAPQASASCHDVEIIAYFSIVL
jgi:hypothetical protein